MSAELAKVSPLHQSLTQLRSHFNQIRTLSLRLYALHPNDVSVPFLALELRDNLQVTSRLIASIDAGIVTVWSYMQDMTLQERLGRIALRPEQLDEIRQETDDLVERFMRRCQSIKRESRCERRERKAQGEVKEPDNLDDWLDCQDQQAVSVGARYRFHCM